MGKQTRRAAACLFAVLPACAKSPPAPVVATRPVTVETPTAPAPTRGLTSIGTSVKGQPILLHRFGDGADVTLIFCAIHGDETSAADVGRRLVDHFGSQPPPQGRTVLLIPVVNPDGVAARTRQNANGVDCNRNFPASNWRPTPRTRIYAGPAPASEPETRAIVDAVRGYRPNRVLSVHAGLRCNNFDGPAEDLARRMASHNHYPVQPEVGYSTPGSFGTWAGLDLGLPVVTLELPRGGSGEKAWLENRDAVLAVVGAGPPFRPEAQGLQFRPVPR